MTAATIPVTGQASGDGGAATSGRELPVLRGLARTRLTGKEIAAILGVSPPTVSKWRHGRAPVPAPTLQFLTLLLAERLQAMVEAAHRRESPVFHPRLRGEIEALRDDLEEQEAINALLPARALHDGTRRFRDWWRAQGWAATEPAE